MIQPQRPRQISEYARTCLEALSASGLGRFVSIGGAFGLAHYFEYRETHDVDAWWVESVSTQERQNVLGLLEQTLRRFGEVKTRAWGDVVSVELVQQAKTVFSFQIARRSAQLAESVPSSWAGIGVDSFDDLVASKMVALIERGAPRDFRDIYMLCQSERSDAARCWNLWRARQEHAGESVDPQRAQLAIHTHLARIEQARPIQPMEAGAARRAAEQLRNWFGEEFLRGLEN